MRLSGTSTSKEPKRFVCVIHQQETSQAQPRRLRLMTVKAKQIEHEVLTSSSGPSRPQFKIFVFQNFQSFKAKMNVF